MATVVITFFLFVQFYVCKMDADCIERQRDQRLSRREKRWSMSSQRIDEIVAALMRPISSDSRRCFDTDLAALLEEYLTEAGLRALEAGEAGEAGDADTVAPNYAELALLLQQSAAIYGRKVDYLYQHVLDVSESLQAPPEAAEEARASPSAEPVAGPSSGPSGRPARRPAVLSGLAAFQRITFPGASRERNEYNPATSRPHPQLPNTFTELEPRVMTASSWGAIYDYDNEFVGLPDDFAVTTDIYHSETGMLVDDFEPRTLFDPEGPRPISMSELQEAIDAAMSPLPPSSPLRTYSPAAAASPLGAGPSSPLRTSTPLPGEAAAPDQTAARDQTAAPDQTAARDQTAAPEQTAACDQTAAPDQTAVAEVSSEVALQTPVKRERKRRHSVINMDDIIEGGLKININEDLRQQLVEIREFSIPTRWIKRIVKKRKSYILSERWRLRELNPDPRAEFAGWSLAEATEAAATVKSWRALEPDSDDDGFFEQSSVGDGCDTSRVDDRSRADDTSRVDDRSRADDTSRVDDRSRADDTSRVDDRSRADDTSRVDDRSRADDTSRVDDRSRADDTSRVDDRSRADDTSRVDDRSRADDTSRVDDTSRTDETSRADESRRADDTTGADESRRTAESSEWASWQETVVARAAAAEARGALDVHALGRSVLGALTACDQAHQPQTFHTVLLRTARTDQEVSHVLLATLFLANAGNVRIVPDEPSESEGSESFSLQLLSDDERLYSVAAAPDADQFLR